MSTGEAIYGFINSIWRIFLEVILFWQSRLHAWWNRKPLKRVVTEALLEARIFEEWEAAAHQLDEIQGNDLWRQNLTCKYYDYRLIYQRLQSIIEAREEDDILSLVNLLRSGLVRNLGNITTPRLFNRAYAGTKLLIEDYITQVALAIEAVAAYPTTAGPESGLTSQGKLDLLHDTRQAFGRTALILQGGSIFGLCHLGVVKALLLRGLLPRIIVGTATGALIAAIVGVHSEHELLDLLSGNNIELDALTTRAEAGSGGADFDDPNIGWITNLTNRISLWIKGGYFVDAKGLEQCAKAYVGDLTFEEAYGKTKRVLNITIPDDTGGYFPTLLNYLTAPNVLIWPAAVVSGSATIGPSPCRQILLCKSAEGEIQPWLSSSSPKFKNFPPSYSSNASPPYDSPLTRVTELFNVNHFLVSQARPYLIPFLQTGDILSQSLPRHSTTRWRGWFWLPLLRVVMLEVQHRLRQLDSLDLLPPSIRRLLIDENIPTASLMLVPELTTNDFWRLIERPTKQNVNDWILRGERSVWPAIGALKVRCAVEVELDRAYQIVRRRKPLDAVGMADEMERTGSERSSGVQGQQNLQNHQRHQQQLRGSGEKRSKRRRTSSLVEAKNRSHSHSNVSSSSLATGFSTQL